MLTNPTDHTATNSEVVHSQIAYWPKYYWLYEHDRQHTVIRVPGPQDMLEIEQMMKAAQAQCTHKSRPGNCIHIEKATFDDWLETHPGE